MATATRTIKVRFDGSTSGLDKAAAQADKAISQFNNRVALSAAGLTAVGVGTGALLAGATTLFAGLAAAGLASSDTVKTAFTKMGTEVKKGLQEDASVLSDTAVGVAQKLGRAFEDLRPTLRSTFVEIIPQVERLTDGLIGLVQNAMPGLASAARSAGPAVEGISSMLEAAGRGVSGFFEQLTTGAPRAGVVFASLGQLLEQVLPVLGQLLAVASDFAAGAMPALTSGIGGALSVLSSLLSVLKPIAPELGTIAGVVLSLIGTFKLLGGMVASVKAVEAAFGGLGTRLDGLAARVSGGTAVTSRFQSILGVVGRTLPIVAIAAAGLGLAYDALRSKADESAQAVANGSMTFRQAVDEELKRLQARRAAYEGMQGEGYAAGQVIGEMTGKIDANKQALADQAESVRLAEEGWQRYKATLSPLEALQAEVTRRQGEYVAALQEFGPAAQQTTDAQGRLAEATTALETAQEAATRASRDHRDALIAQTETIAGVLDASLAYEQQLIRNRDAEHDVAVAVRDHGAGSKEATEASLALQEQYARTADAARDKAAADNASKGEQAAAAAGANAYNLELQRLAGQQNGPGRSAALGLIDRLGDSELAAFDAANATSGFGTTVVQLPSGRTVRIIADVAQAQAALVGIQNQIRNINGKTVSIYVNARGDAGGIASAGRLAAGGNAYAGRSYLVGERGPELLTMGTSGTVTPNHKLGGDTYVTVKIGDQELRGIVQTEISESSRATRRAALAGAGRGV